MLSQENQELKPWLGGRVFPGPGFNPQSTPSQETTLVIGEKWIIEGEGSDLNKDQSGASVVTQVKGNGAEI